jgi:predicted RNA-binding Zn-ribbon protein involved in translation (DUF1610 family)
VLVCAECEKPIEDGRAELAFYCPACAELEFILGNRARSTQSADAACAVERVPALPVGTVLM